MWRNRYGCRPPSTPICRRRTITCGDGIIVEEASMTIWEMWERFTLWVSDLSLGSILLRMALAVAVGVLIGADRRDKNKGAGVRTHAMVCMGAAMTMIISQYIKVRFPEMQGDVFRLGAAVISGIGFLGAGTIIVGDRNRIHGLTTAAGLWTCACIGLAAGAGFIEGTLVAMLAAYLILHNLTALDVKLRKHARTFDLYVEFVDIDAVRDFLHELDVRGIKYSELVTQESPISGEGVVSTLSVELHSYNEKKTFLRNMKEYEGITYFELA